MSGSSVIMPMPSSDGKRGNEEKGVTIQLDAANRQWLRQTAAG